MNYGIIEQHDGVIWHMIRGQAFTNRISHLYPPTTFKERIDAEMTIYFLESFRGPADERRPEIVKLGKTPIGVYFESD
tara:strand:- start:5 stop:238 length:234 start_codon:yes stop_codon:yes gene_type:complete